MSNSSISEEDNIVISDFFFEIPGRSRAIFTKTALLDRNKVESINSYWSSREMGRHKVSIITWHVENSESSAYDYVSLLMEAEETSMKEKVIDVLETGYQKSLSCSVEEVYQAIELSFEIGFPVSLTVELAVNKDAEEIEGEITKRREREKWIQENSHRRLSVSELEQKWEESQKKK